MAGLAIGRSDQHERIAGDLNSVGGVLIPVFFVLIGVNADLARDAATERAARRRPCCWPSPSSASCVSAYGAIGTRSDRLLIGIGMIPRGEVGLIFASIGLAQGVLDDELYGALLLVVLLTTVVTPPALRWRVRMRARDERRSATTTTTAEPAGGWVSLADGELVLAGRPPSSAIVSVALQAAALARSGRPADDLLSWFGERRDVEVDVEPAATPSALLDVLRRGGPRAVRLLDVTGVLERGVPTVAAAVARRRADPSELDPLRVLRFPTVARVDELLDESAGRWSTDRRSVKLAALVLDVLGLDADAVRRAPAARRARRRRPCTRRARALLGAAAACGRRRRPRLRPCRAAPARRPGRLGARCSSRRPCSPVASSHRRTRVIASTSSTSSSPTCSPTPTCSTTMPAPLADLRRRAAEALCHDEASIARLQAAPDSYLLAHEPDELARQARLDRAAARPRHRARRRQPGGHARPLDRRRRLPRHRRPARPARPGPDRRRLRHRRGHGGHVARRRGGRHVPRPLSRASQCPPAGAGDGGVARTSRSRLEPLAGVEIEFDNDGAAVAHDVHRHGPRSARHARRAGGGVRRPPASSCTAPA